MGPLGDAAGPPTHSRGGAPPPSAKCSFHRAVTAFIWNAIKSHRRARRFVGMVIQRRSLTLTQWKRLSL